MARIIETVALSALVATSAHAQLNTIEFKVSNVISPEQPAATVEAWALWDPAQYAFADAVFDVLAVPDAGGFSDPQRILNGPGTYDGNVAPDGDSVTGIIAGQLHYPAHGIFADLANPILMWKVTWTTDVFTPRIVDVATLTNAFYVYTGPEGHTKNLIGDFVEGNGVIQVVPAPAGFAALLAGAAPALRRRRTP